VSATDPLQRFTEARIGGEPFDDELQSDLFLQTLADAAAVTGALVNSDRAGLGGPNLVTRTVNGAGKTAHLLTGSLSAREGSLVRGFGLLALALGGTFLGIDLLTRDTPGWVTVLAFGILLGALAVAALRTRQPILALALGTPVVPLLVLGTAVEDGDGDGISVLTRLAEIAGVAGVILTLLVIGTVREPSSDDPARRAATIDEAGEDRARRRRVVVVTLGIAALLGAGYAALAGAPGLAQRLIGRGGLPVWTLVAVLVLAVLLVLARQVAMRRLRHRVEDAGLALVREDADEATFREARRRRATAGVLWRFALAYTVGVALLGGLVERALRAVERPRQAPAAVELAQQLAPVVVTLALLALLCLAVPLWWGMRRPARATGG
jgi:hypothetical protein